MTTPTNTQIWTELNKLRKELQEQLQTMSKEVVFNRDERKTDLTHLASAIEQLKKDLDVEEMVKSRAEVKRLGLGLSDFLKMRSDLTEMKERMNTYEQTANENNQLLKDIKPAVEFVKNSMRVLKWAGILIATGVLGQVGIYTFHLISGR